SSLSRESRIRHDRQDHGALPSRAALRNRVAAHLVCSAETAGARPAFRRDHRASSIEEMLRTISRPALARGAMLPRSIILLVYALVSQFVNSGGSKCRAEAM